MSAAYGKHDIERLEAEIERLRAALETISQSGSQNPGENMLRAIARRALEPKP